jgi:hypothetical protein
MVEQGRIGSRQLCILCFCCWLFCPPSSVIRSPSFLCVCPPSSVILSLRRTFLAYPTRGFTNVQKPFTVEMVKGFVR